MKVCKPFVKWVGGKTQLIGEIQAVLPADLSTRTNLTYIEPFVGGGAVLFWMLKNYANIKKAVINDINPELTNAYQTIKQTPSQLIELLSDIQENYLKLSEELRKEYFLSQREKYNFQNLEKVERAAIFIFLNRTCFNGLYRVNKKGQFNVPFGRYSNPKICDIQTILANSEALQKVEIITGDFTQTLNRATDNTFFYFDPPYKPISSTSSFTTYTKEDFDDNDQIRLGQFCTQINALGHQFILSNSDPKNYNNENNFFDELYSEFQIQRVTASRMINSKATARGKISEILVSSI